MSRPRRQVSTYKPVPVDRRRNTWADIERRIQRTDTCWLWQGSHISVGYPVVNYGGRKWRTHRLVYEHYVGPIPDGLHLDHLCRNRGCINPDHLEPVTCSENIMRGWDARRPDREDRCPNGHEGQMNRVSTTGALYCRICSRAIQKRWLAAKKAA